MIFCNLDDFHKNDVMTVMTDTFEYRNIILCFYFILYTRCPSHII